MQKAEGVGGRKRLTESTKGLICLGGQRGKQAQGEAGLSWANAKLQESSSAQDSEQEVRSRVANRLLATEAFKTTVEGCQES